jgi:hypothetical protein
MIFESCDNTLLIFMLDSLYTFIVTQYYTHEPSTIRAMICVVAFLLYTDIVLKYKKGLWSRNM